MRPRRSAAAWSSCSPSSPAGRLRRRRLHLLRTAGRFEDVVAVDPADEGHPAGLTLPSLRATETNVGHQHIEALIEGFARQQGRPSQVRKIDND